MNYFSIQIKLNLKNKEILQEYNKAEAQSLNLTHSIDTGLISG